MNPRRNENETGMKYRRTGEERGGMCRENEKVITRKLVKGRKEEKCGCQVVVKASTVRPEKK